MSRPLIALSCLLLVVASATATWIVRGRAVRQLLADLPALPAPLEPFQVEVVADGLVFPASIDFTPDGRLLILERGSYDTATDHRGPPRLVRVDLATGALDVLTGELRADVTPAAAETINGGAMALALSADFAATGHVFVCYHVLADPGHDDSGVNRLSRFSLGPKGLGDEVLLVDGAPGGANHNGCRVAVGPDGFVYMTTGTGSDSESAQNLSSLGGKILRVGPDGSVPPDNPFADSAVWTYGHRNPQGLAFDPAGRLWATEHGPNTDDELNLIEKGKNYGWPYCGGEVALGDVWGRPSPRAWIAWSEFRGRCGGPGLEDSTYAPAVKSYYPNRSLAISDITFYSGDAFPGWRGSLFFVTLKTGRLVRVVLDGPRVVGEELLIDGDDPANYGRLRDVAVGPDGAIYVVTNVTNPAGQRGAPPRAPNPRGGLLLRIAPPAG